RSLRERNIDSDGRRCRGAASPALPKGTSRSSEMSTRTLSISLLRAGAFRLGPRALGRESSGTEREERAMMKDSAVDPSAVRATAVNEARMGDVRAGGSMRAVQMPVQAGPFARRPPGNDGMELDARKRRILRRGIVGTAASAASQ